MLRPVSTDGGSADGGSADGGSADGGRALGGRGGLLALVLQLASVELQMCLYDQPGPTSGQCEALLPACCHLLEEVKVLSSVYLVVCT